MNFHSLEKAVAQKRWQYYEEINTEYANNIDVVAQDHFQIAPLTEEYANYLPSDDSLCQCSFLNNKYRSHLQSTVVGDSLSIDHTYKVASNIGYFRSDRKWISQYD